VLFGGIGGVRQVLLQLGRLLQWRPEAVNRESIVRNASDGVATLASLTEFIAVKEDGRQILCDGGWGGKNRCHD
jgi:hypothetical protein